MQIQVGKVELGTSLRTAQMQIAADELDVSMSKIDYLQGDTWFTPDQGTTAGSQSIKTQWAEGLRHAAAEARAVLMGLASKQLGVPADQLTVTDGVVASKTDASKKATYGELIGGKRFDLKITGKVQPKKPSELKVVGRALTSVDLADKVRSKQPYIHNLQVPGMLHGRVVRPPGINATLVSVDGFPKRIPGLVEVVVQKDFVGVVCEREEQAIKAARTLKVTWKDAGGVPTYDELYESMVKQVGTARLLAQDGDVDKAHRRGCQEGRSGLLLPVPAPRVDGSVVRRRGRPGQRGDGLVSDAGRVPVAPGGREDAQESRTETST